MVNVDGYNVIISYPRTWTKHGSVPTFPHRIPTFPRRKSVCSKFSVTEKRLALLFRHATNEHPTSSTNSWKPSAPCQIVCSKKFPCFPVPLNPDVLQYYLFRSFKTRTILWSFLYIFCQLGCRHTKQSSNPCRSAASSKYLPITTSFPVRSSFGWNIKSSLAAWVSHKSCTA